jgi:hypothetical protein
MGMIKGMRVLFLCAAIAACSQAAAREESTIKVRLNVSPERLCISENGVFIRTKNAGDIGLSNLQFDKGAYYTICKVSCVCQNCHKEFRCRPALCDQCGSFELRFVGTSEDQQSEQMTVEKVVSNCLTDPECEAILCSDELSLQGHINDQGVGADGEYKHSNEDESVSFSARGSVTVRPDGEVEKSIEFRLDVKIE